MIKGVIIEMSKNLATTKENKSSESEFINLLEKFEDQLQNIREVYKEVDPRIPSYDWLCGVQDGINLFVDALSMFLSEDRETHLSISDFQDEVRAITSEIKWNIEHRIVGLYTLHRLPEFLDSRKTWKRIKKLG